MTHTETPSGGTGGRLAVERMSLDNLSQDPANARLHPDRNLEAIVASLRRFGQQKPIVVDSSNVIRAGNGTVAAARVLGWTEIDVVRTDLQGAEAMAYAIADNRTGELAEWDSEILAASLNGFDEGQLSAIGWSEDELSGLLHDFEPLAEPNIGPDYDASSDTYMVKIFGVSQEDKDAIVAAVNEAIEDTKYTAAAY